LNLNTYKIHKLIKQKNLIKFFKNHLILLMMIHQHTIHQLK